MHDVYQRSNSRTRTHLIFCSSVTYSVGYVEFYDEESVIKAIALTGQKILGIPVIAKHTESEKNRLALQAASQT